MIIFELDYDYFWCWLYLPDLLFRYYLCRLRYTAKKKIVGSFNKLKKRKMHLSGARYHKKNPRDKDKS